MKFSHHLSSVISDSGLALLVIGLCATALPLQAAERNELPIGQQLFASPDEAINALKSAAQSDGQDAFIKLYGADFKTLLTGDAVQDANNAKRFASALAAGCVTVPEGEHKVTLEIGTNNWPMPIPLVKVDGKWFFDTASGKDEIISRHIGKDELHTIGVCRAYVTAQHQFANLTKNADGVPVYALKYKSTPGKKDGLYWATEPNEAPSPFGPLLAAAHAEGYAPREGNAMRAFHGYYFRILIRQGKDAPGGKMDYLRHGSLTDGFALVAYPEHWGQSGIMTFIVNQDGQVFQKDLGEKTSRLASAIKEYNPDSTWKFVSVEGVTGVVSEK